MIDYHFYARYAGYFYLFSNLLLLVTKFIGHEVNGAKRWIKIGPIQFQSAEPAKLAIILFLSVLIVQFGKKLKGFKAPFVLFVLLVQFTIPSDLEIYRNLSTAIIILGITCALIFVAHPKTAPFVLTAGIGLPVGIVGVRGYVSSLGASGNFRFNRVLAWIDPENIPMAAAIRYFRDYTLSAPAVCSARVLATALRKSSLSRKLRMI